MSPAVSSPVKVLSRLFRAKFVAYLKTAFRDGKLGFHGELKSLSQRRNFVEWLSPVAGTEWVVYAKPPFGGPRQVLKYLARYTHRVAISINVSPRSQTDHVTFRWKNYARGNQPATMTLKAVEFITALSTARFAPRLRRSPALRIAGQPRPAAEPRLMPQTVGGELVGAGLSSRSRPACGSNGDRPA